MRILMKGIHAKFSPVLKNYLRKKLLKFDKLLPSSAILEATLEVKTGPRREGREIVHLALRKGGVSKPIFVSVRGKNFYQAIDLAKEKLERQILKNKEKKTSVFVRTFRYLKFKSLH